MWSIGVHFSLTQEFENIVYGKNGFDNVFTFKLGEAKRDKTADNLLSKVLGGLDNALSNDHESDQTRTTGNWIGDFSLLGENKNLEVVVQTVHDVIKGPSKILGMSVISNVFALDLN